MQSQSWLVDAWFLFLFFFISRSLHLCSPLGCSCSNSSCCCYSCSGLYECVRWKMFALEKVPKILTLFHTFSLWWWAFSLSHAVAVNTEDWKVSPASVLHLFSQFDLLLFSLTRGWGALHARTHAYSYKCIRKGARAILHFPKKGVVSVWDFFSVRKCFDHNHCVQWKEWVMYRTIGAGRNVTLNFVSTITKKNEEAFKSSMSDAGIVRFLLLHSIYCMYQNIYYLRGSL